MKSYASFLFLGMLLACGTSAAQELENLLAPSRPKTLEFVKAPAPHPALERYYGDPSSRNTVENIRVAATDGARVYAHPEHFKTERLLGIWRIEDSSGRLKFEGDVGVGENWRISPDGKYLFGRQRVRTGGEDHWSLYRTDTWEGLWQLERNKCPSVGGIAFSPDGTNIAIAADLPGKEAHLVILELQTGRTLKSIKIGGRLGDGNRERLLIYTRDAVLLAPACDEQGRITRVAISDGKVEKVTVPRRQQGGDTELMSRLICSPDERWLVLSGGSSYAVFQHVGQDYTRQFEGEVEQPETPGLVNTLDTVAVSPDSRQLVVSGAGQHKVFDLATHKVVHADTTFCRCGIFSRDGRVFWRTCAPFQPIDPTTWEAVKGWDPHGHVFRIGGLAFSPDGRWLLSCDEQRMLIWPVGASDPVVECLSTRKLTWFQSPAWSKDGSRIVGSDGWDFLAWKWVPPAAGGKTTIPGEPLFGAANTSLKRPVMMHLDGNSTWTAFIAQQDKGRDTTSIRYPQKPGFVRHFKLPANLRLSNIDARHAHFSTDGKEVLFSFNGLHAYNVDTDVLRSEAARSNGMPTAHDPVSHSTILRDTYNISLVDEVTLQQRASIRAPSGTTFTNPRSRTSIEDPAVVSADGHWLALCGALRKSDTACLMLLDLKQAQVSAVLPLDLKEFTAAAFTPDSKKLALGHLNGSISVWDVDKLITTAPPSAIPPAVAESAKKPATTAPKPATQGTSPSSEPKVLPPHRWTLDALPREPITMTYVNDSARWQAQPDGAIGAPDVLPYAGRLFVNGQPPVITAARATPPLSSYYTYDAEVEATALSGAIHLKRLLRLSWSGHGYLTDFIENVSSAPVEADVDVEISSPVPLNQLQDDKLQPLSFRGNECALSAEASGIWALVPSAGKKAFFGFSLALGRGAPVPRLIADPASRRIRARHHLKLLPSDRRIFAHHIFVAAGITDADVPKSVPRMAAGNYSADGWQHPAFRLHGVNLAPIPTPSKSAMPNSSPGGVRQVAQDSYFRHLKKDGLGFQWTDALPPCGFSTELGCRSGLEVWLDGAPITFMQEREDARTNTSRITNYEWSNVASTVHVLRREDVQAGSGTFFQALEVENHSDAPRKCRLELVTVLAGPVTALLDASGQSLTATGAIASSAYHGTLAIQTAGTNRPATILALGREGGTIPPPSVTLVNQQLLIARYDLTVGPHEIIPLYHAATQRPLKAYPSFSEALSGWEPLAALPPGLSSPPRNWPSG